MSDPANRHDSDTSRLPARVATSRNAVAVGLVVLVVASVFVVSGTQQRSDRESPLLAVEPFAAIEPIPSDWNSERFADTLARALTADLGVSVSPVGEGSGPPEWILRGLVTMKDRRLVVRATLQAVDSPSTLWSATFWRDSSDGYSVIAQLVAGTSEALRDRAAQPQGQRKP